MRALASLLLLLLAPAARGAEDTAAPALRVLVDWQAHPAMHLPFKIYGEGLTERSPRLSHRHALRQTLHEPYLRASGVRLLLAAAMAAEKARSPEQARRLILDQLDFVEAFVARHPDRYALARSPSEARELLLHTDKTVLVHSIEGGRMILQGPGDAAFWASRGVALVTVTHLVDDELGGAAINPGWLGPLINREGARRRRKGLDRGLTQRGREVIVELDAAGILVDLTHMSPQALSESLALTAAHGIPPVLTHGKVGLIEDSERGQSPEQIVEIYRQGGVFNLALSGTSLVAKGEHIPVPDDVCEGTLDSFRWHHQTLQGILDAALPELFGVSSRSELDEAQRTALATGWSSDWNGGISHSRPRHKGRRCGDRGPRPSPHLELDTRGLAHPGLLPQHFQRLEEDGVDLDPVMRSAERFLELWEGVRGG